MKRSKLFGFASLLFVATAFFTGCDTNDNGGKDAIKVKNNSALTQNVFADETSGKSEVAFTTTGRWTSDISTLDISKAGDSPEWISIDPESGDEAGDYSVSIDLEPNLTGSDRAATITISCDGTEITITVMQKATKSDGSLPIPSVSELLEQYEELYDDAVKAYVQIDAQYSTLSSRMSVTAATPALYDFWQKAYAAIECCNQLVDLLDTETEMTEEEKDGHRAAVHTYRATCYLYLNTLFGGVPLAASMDTSWTDIPRSSEQEINDLVRADLEDAVNRTAGARAYFLLGLHALQNGDIPRAADIFATMINQGKVEFEDVNGDGIFNEADRNEANTMTIQTYLSGSEASLATDNVVLAMQYVNNISLAMGLPPMLSAGSTPDEVRDAIRNTFARWDEGMKFMNTVRWSDMQDWGYRALLPIPQTAMSSNAHLTQNSGW